MIPYQGKLHEWKGETCFILGGGPSLTQADVTAIRGHGRVIAINNAHELAPWADVLYFADRRWFEWNKAKVRAFPGRIVTRSQLVERDGPPQERVERIKRTFRTALSPRIGEVAGWCSGANTINLAWQLGVTNIVLLGFDGGDGNWHDGHKVVNPDGHLNKHSRPSLHAMSKYTHPYVINCSRKTDLRCFHRQPLESFLCSIQTA